MVTAAIVATKWREGDTLWYTVTSWRKGTKWQLSTNFSIYLRWPIDYIAYRLIEPGYESWHNIVIAQELASTKRATSYQPGQ